MEISDIQQRYNKTFGKINRTNQSYLAFINLLYDLDLIEDTQYYDLKQRNISDNFDVVGESIITKKLELVPLFEEFIDGFYGLTNNVYPDNSNFLSDIFDNLEKANYIIFKEVPGEENELNYKKSYDDKGIVQWINVDTDEAFDNLTIAKVIDDKLQDFSNSLVMHGDYLNIIRGKEGNKYFDVKGLFNMLNDFYFIITGSQIESSETWGTFLKHAEEAGIIDSQQKNILYNNYVEK